VRNQQLPTSGASRREDDRPSKRRRLGPALDLVARKSWKMGRIDKVPVIDSQEPRCRANTNRTEDENACVFHSPFSYVPRSAVTTSLLIQGNFPGR
jgi:hypothetical protein